MAFSHVLERVVNHSKTWFLFCLMKLSKVLYCSAIHAKILFLICLMTFSQVCDWVAIKNLLSILSSNDILSGFRLDFLHKIIALIQSNEVLSCLGLICNSRKNFVFNLTNEILSILRLGCNLQTKSLFLFCLTMFSQF